MNRHRAGITKERKPLQSSREAVEHAIEQSKLGNSAAEWEKSAQKRRGPAWGSNRREQKPDREAHVS